MNLDWRIWRIIIEKMATLHELRTIYDLNDLWDFHEALDLKMDAEYQAMQGAKK